MSLRRRLFPPKTADQTRRRCQRRLKLRHLRRHHLPILPCLPRRKQQFHRKHPSRQSPQPLAPNLPRLPQWRRQIIPPVPPQSRTNVPTYGRGQITGAPGKRLARQQSAKRAEPSGREGLGSRRACGSPFYAPWVPVRPPACAVRTAGCRRS